MDSPRTRAWIIFCMWSVVLLVVISLFFVGSGPEEWGTDSNRRFSAAVIFGIAYSVFFYLQFKIRQPKKDERDFLIELKASSASMICILIYVFAFCISIFVYYENENWMPVSWMWFIAYTTVILSYIVNSGFYLWYEKRVDGYGRN